MSELFDQNQKREAIDLIESVSWLDADAWIRVVEWSLALALEATREALGLWEAEGEARYGDLFILSAEQIAEMDDEWRLAYTARLLQEMAIAYGVDPWAPPARTPDGVPVSPPDLEENEGIAPLVRGLNDIVHGLSPSTA